MRRFGPATAFGGTAAGLNAVIVTVSTPDPEVSVTCSPITNAPATSGVKLGAGVLPPNCVPASALPAGALCTVQEYVSASPLWLGSLLALPFRSTGDPLSAFAAAPAFAFGGIDPVYAVICTTLGALFTLPLLTINCSVYTPLASGRKNGCGVDALPRVAVASALPAGLDTTVHAYVSRFSDGS